MYFDVGNLLELPAAAVLLCGCRSWLPVAAALGSSSVATSSATRLLLAVLLIQRRHACARCWPALAPLPFGSLVPPGRSQCTVPHRPLSSVRVRWPWGMYSLKPVR